MIRMKHITVFTAKDLESWKQSIIRNTQKKSEEGRCIQTLKNWYKVLNDRESALLEYGKHDPRTSTMERKVRITKREIQTVERFLKEAGIKGEQQ